MRKGVGENGFKKERIQRAGVWILLHVLQSRNGSLDFEITRR